jgi:hypothetical protein
MDFKKKRVCIYFCLDFEMGLTIEPNNKSLLDELKKLPPAATTITKAEKLKV